MKTWVGDLLDHMQDDVALIGAAVISRKKVSSSAPCSHNGGDFHGVTGVAQLHEIDALDDATGADVKAGDDALASMGCCVRSQE